MHLRAKGVFMHVCLPISDMSSVTAVQPTSFVIVLLLQFAPLHIRLRQRRRLDAFLMRVPVCYRTLFRGRSNKRLNRLGDGAAEAICRYEPRRKDAEIPKFRRSKAWLAACKQIRLEMRAISSCNALDNATKRNVNYTSARRKRIVL